MTYNQEDARLEFSEQTDVINEYCSKYPPGDFYFNLDGIVNISEWKKDGNEKVCFFMKESYRGKRNDYLDSYIYPLIKELKECEPWKMWKRAAKWSYLINNIKNIESTSDINFEKGSQKDYIQKTAIINIIKVIKNSNLRNEDLSIGNKTTSYKSLKEHIFEDAELLLKQFEVIKPKYIICGYTFSLFIKLLMFRDGIIEKEEFLNKDYMGSKKKVDIYLEKEFDKIGDAVYFNKKYIIVDTYHLAYTKEQPSEEHIRDLKSCFRFWEENGS